MRIYSKNIPAKFHPDPIWNDEALVFFEDGRPNKKNKKNNNNKMSSEKRYEISYWSKNLHMYLIYSKSFDIAVIYRLFMQGYINPTMQLCLPPYKKVNLGGNCSSTCLMSTCI